ncbi:unnamed protein product [Vitrella brassicaformis CCMP3155]|uniref:Hexosyltransferase n=1 Tax=Vitrella brassicaformis (strain CCMP3155) TaxID=1169540 RepID=A0A0G4GUF1_VITBC|nr:unnamed protein product [Vitrella brassicaformis CCMP3155]|eukprot:CEM34465.1 unnamed protein product [Vitrella brassicaformis CCMP3155]
MNSASGSSGGSTSCAYITLLTSDSFAIGVETLAFSLRKTGTPHPFIVLVGPQVSERTFKRLSERKGVEDVRRVDGIANPHAEEGCHEPGWVNSGFTKLHVWSLTEFQRVVYIDADCIVMRKIDCLFDPAAVSCPAFAPDVFPPDRFNAGVMVIEPSLAVYEDLLAKRTVLRSYDRGDTGFLNAYFSGWYGWDAKHRLAFHYNAQRTMHWMTHSKQPGYWDECVLPCLSVLHLSSSPKPWESPDRKGPTEWLWWNMHIQMNIEGG